MADNGVQMTVMADYPSEKTTDVPEHAYVRLAWLEYWFNGVHVNNFRMVGSIKCIEYDFKQKFCTLYWNLNLNYQR